MSEAGAARDGCSTPGRIRKLEKTLERDAYGFRRGRAIGRHLDTGYGLTAEAPRGTRN
jgi:hypothetical protein